MEHVLLCDDIGGVASSGVKASTALIHIYPILKPTTRPLNQPSILPMATSAVTSATDAVKSVVSSAASTIAGTTLNDNTNEPETTGVTDESPQVGDAKQKLERKLSLRPEREELVERNILKNTSVAPSLQAAQADLERAQLEDKLEQKLQARPKPDELVKEGILNADEVPGV